MSEIKKLEETLDNATSELAKSYRTYNELVQSILSTLEMDYTSVYGLKKAILQTLSKHLHG